MVCQIHQVIVQSAPAKFLTKLRDESLRVRFDKVLDSLEHNPRPTGCVKLKGMKNAYRVRVGEYRIIYEIYGRQLVVLVIEIGHRREIYRH
jgi:mRNA interferase RelE/StbE